MEEENDIKEKVKEDVLSIKDIDLGILEAYNGMPKEFRERLNFNIFYNFHRKRIENEVFMHQFEKPIETSSNTSDETEEKISEDELCKLCAVEKHAWDDPDLCIKCREKLKKESQNKQEEIKNELLRDKGFIMLTSEEAAKAYVKQKYLNDKNLNKFVALTTVAKEAYQLKKMQK